MRADEIVLTADEVVIVRGWYEGRTLADMGADIRVTRQAIALRVRQMRRRGIPLPERPTSWRATRKNAAGSPQQIGGAA